MADDKEFFGKTINGDISRFSDGPSEQADPQEFIDALDKLMAHPDVLEVSWHQYTPYFNDGEACTFSAYGAEVKLNINPDEDYDPQESYAGEGFYGEYDLYRWRDAEGNLVQDAIYKVNGFDTKSVSEALKEFDNVLQDGSHYVILNQKFGDPAQVYYDGTEFRVEFYDHD